MKEESDGGDLAKHVIAFVLTPDHNSQLDLWLQNLLNSEWNQTHVILANAATAAATHRTSQWKRAIKTSPIG